MTPYFIALTISSIVALLVALGYGWVSYQKLRRLETSLLQSQEKMRRMLESKIEHIESEQAQGSMMPLPEEVREQATELVREGFKLFGEHSKELAEELANFNEQQQQAKERIERGARRTQGGVV